MRPGLPGHGRSVRVWYVPTARSLETASTEGDGSVSRRTAKPTAGSVVVVLTIVAAMLVAPGAAQGQGSVRGYDGKVMKIGGFGMLNNFPNGDIGARARFKLANDNNELKDVEFEYTDYIDDKQDAATALSVARQLVTQHEVFAIVPDFSQYNPGDYLNAQKVPYIGWAFDGSYCSEKPSTKLYGFGFNGCLIPPNPIRMPDAGAQLYKYVSAQTGKKKPTLALFSNETDAGRRTVSSQAAGYAGAGFKVVYFKGLLPPPPLPDVTPFVQTLMTSDKGKAPDAMVCLLAVDCIAMYTGLKANGYEGVFQSPLYSDLLTRAMEGSVASVQFVPFDKNTPAQQKMKAAVEAVKPGQAISSDIAISYFAADMLIQGIKKVIKDRKPITPENVQAAMSRMTFGIEGAFGPTRYPESTVRPTPACTAIVLASATAWTTVEDFACSSKTFPVTARYRDKG